MATFACPHCAKAYPIKPQLVGRPVRCACGAAFVLQADGTARPHGPAQPVAQPAASERRQRSRDDHRRRQAELRSRLGDTLQTAATRAAGQAASRAAEQPAARPATGASEAGPRGTAAFRPVITDQAQQDHQRDRWWQRGLLVAAGLVILITAVTWLSARPDPRVRALAAYGEAPPRDLAPELKLEAVRERAWLKTRDGRNPLPALTGLDDARLGHIQRLDSATLTTLRDFFADLDNHRELALLAPRGAMPAPAEVVFASWLGPADRQAFLTEHPELLAYEDVPERLRDLGLDALSARAVACLIAGTTGSEREPLELLRDQDLTALDLSAFSGDDASRRYLGAGGLRAEPGQRYSGILMRPVTTAGADDGAWRVLDLSLGDEPPASAPDLPISHRLASLDRVLTARATAARENSLATSAEGDLIRANAD